MKLYTEEQVLKMIEVCRDSDLYEHILTFEDILKTVTPIELPSDDEIIDVYDSHIDLDLDWIVGAQWMRDKIQGGDK